MSVFNPAGTSGDPQHEINPLDQAREQYQAEILTAHNRIQRDLIKRFKIPTDPTDPKQAEQLIAFMEAYETACKIASKNTKNKGDHDAMDQLIVDQLKKDPKSAGFTEAVEYAYQLLAPEFDQTQRGVEEIAA